MIAVGALAGISLVLMQMSKSQSGMSAQSQIESDASQIKTDIQSLLNGPANCNANFFGRPAGVSSATTLYKCISGVCHGTNIAAQPQFTVNTTDWNLPNVYTNKVKVTSITYNVTHTDLPAFMSAVLTSANLTITALKKVTHGAGQSALKDTITMNFYTTVVYDGTNVTGCPRSLNTTVPY